MPTLIVVDMQNDFIGGSLAVPDAVHILPVVNRVINKFAFSRLPIIYTKDMHPPMHKSFASMQGTEPFTMGVLNGQPQMFWPDHCVVETPGNELHSQLLVVEGKLIVEKGTNPQFDSYSGFEDAGRNPTAMLQTLAHAGTPPHDNLIICGLATDYCVKATALDAVKRGYVASVLLDACKGVDPKTTVEAIEEMAKAGVLIEHTARLQL